MNHKQLVELLNTPAPTGECIKSIDNLTLLQAKWILQKLIDIVFWNTDEREYIVSYNVKKSPSIRLYNTLALLFHDDLELPGQTDNNT